MKRISDHSFMEVNQSEGIHIDDRINYIEVKLSVIQFRENNVEIIYSPALDISGYGETIHKAKDSFEIALDEFIRYTMSKGTFIAELEKLGWKITGKKRNRRYEPPYFDHLLRDREYLSQIVRNKEFTKSDQCVSLPA